MIMRVLTTVLLAASCLFSAGGQSQKQWWQTWSNFPKVPKISADIAKKLVLSGEKAVFVYAGYKVDEFVCGSMELPYTLVPPNADGSRVNLSAVPKDAWVFCYCP
jgi:hypothetical protein